MTNFPAKHIILTFSSPNLPSTLKAGYLSRKIRPYIQNPLHCFKCQRFGHSQAFCHCQLMGSRFPCLNCGGGDRWCRHLSSLQEFHRAKSYRHLSGSQG
ncbi:hypothetical protein TNCV_286521 [Trichonephila clavipes]|nr:hypothetical protein TNCV_286521 [Trichonephila clavipes]